MSKITITVDFPWDPNEEYYVLVDEGFVVDANTAQPNEEVSDTTDITFTTLPPPSIDYSNINEAGAPFKFRYPAVVTVTFPEEVTAVASKDITVTEVGTGVIGTYSATDFDTEDNKTFKYEPPLFLDPNKTYTVSAEAGAFIDSCSFESPVTAGEVIGNEDELTLVDSTITIDFCQVVSAGSGNISLYKTAANVFVETININDCTIEDNGDNTSTLVIPTCRTLLDPSIEYYVTAASGIIVDANGFKGALTPSTPITVNYTKMRGPLVFDFDRNVFAGTGHIYIKLVSDDSTVKDFNMEFDVYDATDNPTGAIKFVGNLMVITADLTQGESYYVVIDEDSVVDIDGIGINAVSSTTAYDFTVYDGPSITSFDPSDGSIGIYPNQTFTITFDSNVNAPACADIPLLIKRVSDNTQDAVIPHSDVVFNGNTATFTMNPSYYDDIQTGTEYYISFANNATFCVDDDGFYYHTQLSNSDWNFTTYTSVNYTSTVPADNETNVDYLIFSITFPVDITEGAGNIYLKKTSDNSIIETIDVADATFLDNVVSFNVSALIGSTEMYINYDAGAFIDEFSNPIGALTTTTDWSFTATNAPSIIASAPADNDTDVTNMSMLLRFDENIDTILNNYVRIFRTSDDALIETPTLSFTDDQLTFTLTQLEPQTEYYILIDENTIVDVNGIANTAVTDKTLFSFTTGGTSLAISSLDPADDEVGADNTTLTLTFNQNVNAETGSIIIYRSSDDSAFESFSVPGDITIVGDDVSFNLTGSFDPDEDYYIQVSSGAFSSDSWPAHTFDGINDETTWNFTSTESTSPIYDIKRLPAGYVANGLTSRVYASENHYATLHTLTTASPKDMRIAFLGDDRLLDAGYRIYSSTGYNITAQDIQFDSLGNVFVLCIDTDNFVEHLLKLDSNGTGIWGKRINSSAGGGKLAVDSSDNVYAIFYNTSAGADVMKVSAAGTVAYHLEFSSVSKIYDITAKDGNVYFSVKRGSGEPMIAKLDSSGTTLWAKRFYSSYTAGGGLYVNDSDDVYFAGISSNTPTLVKFNSSGVVQWENSYSGPSASQNYSLQIVKGLNDALFIIGDDDNGATSASWYIRTQEDGTLVSAKTINQDGAAPGYISSVVVRDDYNLTILSGAFKSSTHYSHLTTVPTMHTTDLSTSHVDVVSLGITSGTLSSTISDYSLLGAEGSSTPGFDFVKATSSITITDLY